MNDQEYMIDIAIYQAKKGLDEGGIPIGAAVALYVKELGGRVVSAGRNRRVQENSQIKHAEVDALESAGPGDYRGATMYTTLQPCWMCSGALVQFGFTRVVVGEAETFDPGTTPFLESHGIEVVVLDLEECKAMMREFIEKNPKLWAQDIGNA